MRFSCCVLFSMLVFACSLQASPELNSSAQNAKSQPTKLEELSTRLQLDAEPIGVDEIRTKVLLEGQQYELFALREGADSLEEIQLQVPDGSDLDLLVFDADETLIASSALFGSLNEGIRLSEHGITDEVKYLMVFRNSSDAEATYTLSTFAHVQTPIGGEDIGAIDEFGISQIRFQRLPLHFALLGRFNQDQTEASDDIGVPAAKGYLLEVPPNTGFELELKMSRPESSLQLVVIPVLDFRSESLVFSAEAGNPQVIGSNAVPQFQYYEVYVRKLVYYPTEDPELGVFRIQARRL
ncbi:MAG: hypothetical protein IPJ88_05005 [Myxococcales bacterium]|nr:MAG: hypothetical protein IPJ88_05005 [Myxococcales bacterium]